LWGYLLSLTADNIFSGKQEENKNKKAKTSFSAYEFHDLIAAFALEIL